MMGFSLNMLDSYIMYKKYNLFKFLENKILKMHKEKFNFHIFQ